MVMCSSYGCKSNSRRKEVGVTFHRFPKEEAKRSLWIENMKNKNFTPTKNYRICSKHFEDIFFYETTTGKTKLLDQAVPTLFIELPKSVQPKGELRKMPAKCSIPNCTSNYASTYEGYVSVFKYPRDNDVRQQWLKSIPRKNWEPSHNSVVCVKHFCEDDLLFYDTYKDKDGVLKSYPRLRPTLREGAVPKIFPGSKDWAKQKDWAKPKDGAETSSLVKRPGSYRKQLKPGVFHGWCPEYQPKPKKLKISDVQNGEKKNVQELNTLIENDTVDAAINSQKDLVGTTIKTSIEDQDILSDLNLISKLTQDNSNIEIEIETDTPGQRSFKPKSVKLIVIKDLSVPLIKVDALEEYCNRLSQENKNLKEILKELPKQSSSLPSLTDNTGKNTSIENQEILTYLNLKSKRTRHNSNIKIEPSAPKYRSYNPQRVKDILLKDRSLPIIKVNALEDKCNRLIQKNKNLKQKLKKLQKESASLPSLTDNTGIDRFIEDQEIERSLSIIPKLTKNNSNIEIERSLSVTPKLTEDNSNIEIDIELKIPEHVSYKPQPVKAQESKNIVEESLKEYCKRLSEENKNLKEKLRKLENQSASLPSQTNNTGTDTQPRDIIDLRDIRDVCRTCLLKSKNLTHINDKITLPSPQSTCLLKSNNLKHINDKITLPIAQTTEIMISKALESILSTPVEVSDNVPNQICETCKNQIIFLATIRCAFEKANAILQFHSTDRLQKKAINKQNTSEKDDTEINISPQCKVEEEDLFEETLNDLHSPEQIDCELVDNVDEDLVSGDDPLEFDNSVANVSEVDPLLLQPDITVEEARPKSSKYSKTRKFKSLISHTCPICCTVLSLADFIPHVKGHKVLQKNLRVPKNILKGPYRASPSVDKGLLSGEGEILHSCHVCQKQLKAVECITHLSQHLAADQSVCDKCGRVFKNKKVLLSHMAVHNDDRPYKCTFCHQSVTRSESLKSHVCTNPGSYRCKYCQKLFETAAARTTHISSVHNSAKHIPGFCRKCNVAVMDLSTHRISKHPTTKHLCTVCGSYVWNIDVHMHKHRTR
ncbi:uncharacterized protein LOC114332213 isoform X2 [Diabrotica virgifera virgifera]|uniref:Uncharacterized protein n=2 Tax=Diabrotica virgifera virgifera TaxID=50390 RepID=A0ABM5JJH1_DIAVI|nr:uncharacterized protein LOC114332213 isoform X2 [Diabrotica virgifera virgifera]